MALAAAPLVSTTADAATDAFQPSVDAPARESNDYPDIYGSNDGPEHPGDPDHTDGDHDGGDGGGDGDHDGDTCTVDCGDGDTNGDA